MRKYSKRLSRIGISGWIIFLLLMSVVINLPKVMTQPIETWVSVDPQSLKDTTKVPGTTFTININVTDVTDLYGYEFRLRYNTTILTAVDYSPTEPVGVGDFFSNVYIWVNKINVTEGYVWLTVTLPLGTPEGGGISGSGVLATVNFTVNDFGWSNLDLYSMQTGDVVDPDQIKLSNSYGDPILHGVNDGTFLNVELQSPIASFTWSPSKPILNHTATLNASGSRDPDGNIVSYEWNFGDGNTTTVSQPVITHVFRSAGNLTVTLTVTDDDGLTGTISKKVPVSTEPNHDITILGIEVSWKEKDERDYVYAGENVTITVNVRNIGETYETFNTTVYYNETEIGTTLLESLTYGDERFLEFQWDTTGVTPGNYTIKAVAGPVPGEKSTADNTLKLGGGLVFVQIKEPPVSTDLYLYIGVSVVAIVAVGIAVYLLKFRKPVSS